MDCVTSAFNRASRPLSVTVAGVRNASKALAVPSSAGNRLVCIGGLKFGGDAVASGGVLAGEIPIYDIKERSKYLLL